MDMEYGMSAYTKGGSPPRNIGRSKRAREWGNGRRPLPLCLPPNPPSCIPGLWSIRELSSAVAKNGCQNLHLPALSRLVAISYRSSQVCLTCPKLRACLIVVRLRGLHPSSSLLSSGLSLKGLAMQAHASISSAAIQAPSGTFPWVSSGSAMDHSVLLPKWPNTGFASVAEKKLEGLSMYFTSEVVKLYPADLFIAPCNTPFLVCD